MSSFYSRSQTIYNYNCRCTINKCRLFILHWVLNIGTLFLLCSLCGMCPAVDMPCYGLDLRFTHFPSTKARLVWQRHTPYLQRPIFQHAPPLYWHSLLLVHRFTATWFSQWQSRGVWQTKSYLTPPNSYTTITTFSPLEGGTECQQWTPSEPLNPSFR